MKNRKNRVYSKTFKIVRFYITMAIWPKPKMRKPHNPYDIDLGNVYPKNRVI